MYGSIVERVAAHLRHLCCYSKVTRKNCNLTEESEERQLDAFVRGDRIVQIDTFRQ